MNLFLGYDTVAMLLSTKQWLLFQDYRQGKKGVPLATMPTSRATAPACMLLLHILQTYATSCSTIDPELLHQSNADTITRSHTTAR
jgi:hypothetical protein